MRSVDPRLRVIFLMAVAIGVLLLKDWRWLAGIAALMIAASVALGSPLRAVVRQLLKLGLFALVIVLSHALVGEDARDDRFRDVEVAGRSFSVNVGGAMVGVAMVLRVVAIVFASQVAKAGDARAIAVGLRRLWAPPTFAASVDAVFALMGPRSGGGGDGRGGGGGGGGGRGGGRGRRGRAQEDASDQRGVIARFVDAVRRMASGDVGFLTDRALQRMHEAEDQAAEAAADGSVDARDVGVIAGLTLTMLAIRAVKILPAIPFAPGHKLVLLTPFYVVGSLMTKSRAGATWMGLTMGVVSFLTGDGKYGVFEILKHVAPGVLCDLLVPLLTANGRRPSRWVWVVTSSVLAAGRYAAIFAVTLLAQPPALAFALLLPGLAVHVSFGFAAGFIVPAFVRAFEHSFVKGTSSSVTARGTP